MEPWLAKLMVVAMNVVMVAIRAPHGGRSSRVRIAKDYKGAREVVLLTLAWIGFFLPLVWVVSPLFEFADYPLRLAPFLVGVMFTVLGLWLFYRSHRDLGVYWSITLQTREDHRLITHGIYQFVRHPMYSALFLCSFGQALALPNWFVGPSNLILFGTLVAFRLKREESMMLELFGDQYTAYMAKTKRLLPFVW